MLVLHPGPSHGATVGWSDRDGRPTGDEGRRLAEAALRWPLGEKDWMAGDGQGTR